MFTLSAVQAHRLPMPHPTHIHPIDAVRAMLHAVGEHIHSEHLYIPPDLNVFLEDAAMSREMRRL